MDEENKMTSCADNQQYEAPAKSIVRVYFPEKNTQLTYFNDLFDLHIGDIVYVEGKLEGFRGEVIDVSHNFKIKVSDYKRIISRADTSVKGRLYILGSHLLAFAPDIIPYEKVLTWYKAPDKEDDAYVSGSDETSFSLSDLKEMHIGSDVVERGHDYYIKNRVNYLCLDGAHGRAIVKGTKAYEVEFTYEDGRISNLTCDCFYSRACKHEFAVMLQLKETLEMLKKEYPSRADGYWAVISKAAFFNAVISDRQTGSLYME